VHSNWLEYFLVLFLLSSADHVICQPFSKEIIPIDKTGFSKDNPNDIVSNRWKELVELTYNEALNTWWKVSEAKGREGTYVDFGYLENNSKSGIHGQETKGGIRPAAQAAYSVAVALFTGIYDPKVSGVSEELARSRAITIVTSLAKDHLANGGINHAWGDQWQSAQWASKTAVSGWLLWDYLGEEDQHNIQRMMEFEANRFLHISPPTANEEYRENTRAEENGWDCTGIQTACALMPKHENYLRWRDKSIDYRLNALATREDLKSDRIVDGRQVSARIVGYNIDKHGGLGNHGAYPHPDYMAAPLRHTIEGALFLQLAEQEVPEANFFNCDIIYRGFVDHIWNESSTLYKPDGSVYWPTNIESDRRFEFITFGILDLGAQTFHYDEDVSIKGSEWENMHTTRAIEMQLTSFIAASAYLLRWLEFQKSAN